MASKPASSDQQMRTVAERIEALVRDFAASPDPAVGQRAQELVRLLMQLYGAGLTRILQILEQQELRAGRRPGEAVAALHADDLVASLLVLHDLHPEDVETRIARSLERVRLVVGTDVTLLGVRDGAARVKVGVPGETPAQSLVDVGRLIESAIHAAAPDIERVDIEGLPRAASSPLVQLARTPPADRANRIPVP